MIYIMRNITNQSGNRSTKELQSPHYILIHIPVQDTDYSDKDIRTFRDGKFFPMDRTFHILRKSR